MSPHFHHYLVVQVWQLMECLRVLTLTFELDDLQIDIWQAGSP